MRRQLAILFVIVALILMMNPTKSEARQLPADQDLYRAELVQLCSVHQVKYCPRLTWQSVKPDRIKDGSIGCGFDVNGDRVCVIVLWTRAEIESVRHEFAHYLTWLSKTDGKNGQFKHGQAFKRARSIVRRGI